MSAHKHTPGPWKWQSHPDEGGFCVYMAEAIHKRSGYEVQHRIEMDFTLYPEDGAQWEEARANTRLIAAAPELLEALENILSNCLDSDGLSRAYENARAAIAKATGDPA